MDDYSPASRLIGAGRIGQGAWSAALTKHVRGFEANQISDIYHRLAPRYSINPDLALAQFCEETGYGTSDRWLQQNNPAGIGITSDEVPGHVFESPEEGIQAHLDHLCCYIYGAAMCPVPHGATPDPRHLFHDGNPALSHLQDSTRQWATKPDYVDRILAIANALLAASAAPQQAGGPTMTVPKPAVDTSHPSPNRGYSNGHTRRVDAICWHISEGTDSLGWLTSPASKASSNYLIARNGIIYELVPPTVDAWANGQVDKPDTSNPLIAKWLTEKVNGVVVNFNQRTISIEHEGFSSKGKGGSLTTAQIASTEALTAWLCSQFSIAPDQTHILGHYEIDSVDRPNCPGFSAAEWSAWVGSVAGMVNAPPQIQVEDDDSPEAHWYLDSSGEPVVEIRWGGRAKKILGVNFADIGITVQGMDDATYDRSLQQGAFKPYARRPA